MVDRTDPLVLRLLYAARTGDNDAFTALYERYSVLVFRTAYLLLGDAGRAEDVTQEVFVRLYQRLGDYQPERAAFSTWLHRITVNACLNARRPRLLAWLSIERAPDLPISTPPPVELALHSEEQRQIWQAVQQLPLKLRAAVVLRYYHDLSYEEVAQALGCPVGTVRSRLHAAHARLHDMLQEDQDELPDDR
jgi:RNA polymerase sigma-70 factor (ECF subfamily)